MLDLAAEEEDEVVGLSALLLNSGVNKKSRISTKIGLTCQNAMVACLVDSDKEGMYMAQVGKRYPMMRAGRSALALFRGSCRGSLK